MQKTKANNKKSHDVVKSISNNEELHDIFAAQFDYSYLSYDTADTDIESYLGAFSCSLSENFFLFCRRFYVLPLFFTWYSFFLLSKSFLSFFLFSKKNFAVNLKVFFLPFY